MRGMPTFTCATCGEPFDVPDAALAKYPGWTPRRCRAHATGGRGGKGANGGGGARARARPAHLDEPRLSPAEVLARYGDPGGDGVFTDGGCVPNPGPGGWGVVWVKDGRIVAERHGHDPATTNNRMELLALVEAYRMLPPDARVRVHSDSNLCVQIVRQWAASWAARGWKRKDGAIANLDLVKELWSLVQERPGVELVWVPAHRGHRWNEYADALASLWQERAAPPSGTP